MGTENSKVKTPMLDKMLEIQGESQICGEFLDYLQTRYAMFEIKTPREEPFYRGVGDYINTEKILAEFFGIDIKRMLSMKKKCDCCNKKRDMVDVFIFREKLIAWIVCTV